MQMEERAIVYGDEIENASLEDAIEVHVGSLSGDSIGALALDDSVESLSSVDGETINVMAIEGDTIRAASIGQGGGTGTKDYNELINKPSIETVTLIGDKTFHDFGYDPMNGDDLGRILTL